MKSTSRVKVFSVVVLLLLFLAACSSSSPTATPAPTDAPAPTDTPKPTATPTQILTQTPTPIPIYENSVSTTWFYATNSEAGCGELKMSDGEIAENTTLQSTGRNRECLGIGRLIEVYAPNGLDAPGNTVWILAKVLKQVGGYTAQPTPRPTQTPRATPTRQATQPTKKPSTAPCSCASDTKNCSNFSTQAQAQRCYSYCKSQTGRDVHKLDNDNDGRACESLP